MRIALADLGPGDAFVRVVPGSELDAMMNAVRAAEEVCNGRISAADLNHWLAGVKERHPPLVDGRRLRLRYATQVNTPPSFAL